ncbi:MAG: glycosyltransferase family 4 protein [Puniceicoccales bacterium]|nr:glycosyltransferase family 4 protein [Puniceicoccales bacterium]
MSVGVGLTRNDGGLTTSVNHFTAALGGLVVVFSRENSFDRSQLIAKEIYQVRTNDNFFGRAFAQVARTRLAEVEEYVANRAKIITCHCLYRFHCHFVYRVFQNYGIPYNIVLHGALDKVVRAHRGMRKSLWLNIFGKQFLANARHVICATRTERTNANKFFQDANYTDLYWPTEFFESKWAMLRRKRQKIRASYGIEKGHRVILCLGRLNRVKNPIDVIKSLAGLPLKVVLFLVGPEDDISINQCKAIAKKCGVKVRCTGFADLEMKEEIFAMADYYISLSRHENFNYSLVEALARGIPAMVSKGNDIYQDLAGERFCRLVSKPEDVHSVLQELVSMSSYETKSLSKSASEWVQRNMQFCDFKNKLVKLYQ